MIRILASPHIERAAAVQANGGLGLALYHIGRSTLPGIGHTLPHEVVKLPWSPKTLEWDLLSIALAVYGTDRFIPRCNSPDGWTRVLALEIEVVDPDPWSDQTAELEASLRFLTGDIWYLRFLPGGKQPPNFTSRITDRDCACLFSGGLDSLIGALDLTFDGRRPLLISQASSKEGNIQKSLASKIGLDEHHFQGRAIEKFKPPYELSSRSRSVLFFAYGALAAAGLGGELFVPENGLISINPPLTRRRIGSLSTRTTHPHFISSIQAIFDHVNLGVTIINPYKHRTKGEMLAVCAKDSLIIRQIASDTYSCGRGKRLNKHCGRCVPCLIRRAAFFNAGIDVNGKIKIYQFWE